MGTIEITQGGNTNNLERFLRNMSKNTMFDSLEAFGQEGVAALESATPRRSGRAATSWYYVITRNSGGAKISWHNSDIDADGVPIVILLQYGHGTGTRGYVPGRDFINPAMDPVFADATDSVWKAVQS